MGTTTLSALILIVFFKLGFVDEFIPKLTELVLCSLLAIALAKTIMQKRTAGDRPLLSFRELVITISIVFATLGSNVGLQALQLKAFGRAYTSSYADPEPKVGVVGVEAPAPPSVVQKMAEMLVSVSAEEVSSRWITLGALLMVMSPGWAIVLSSVLFALLHTVVPIVGGVPDIGLLSLAPTFAIGVGCGVAFVRSGLAAALLVHFLVNMVGLFAEKHTYIADTVIFGSAFVALVVLPLTLWFTRRRTLFFTSAATR
ncbi:CPBP family intramembrane glutamic endopeptidase [Oligoflexus tunisiensis]|uniref:CPBP family intramembrane glutamic endopeptidase n=1 Tax=Oligoflexus tunisiensis TaxID=708132 RepID=UPI001C404023|nr:CPBP family intramembrane glutamic endopeptidase [Oligoflexus tunisiensis]